MLPMRLLRALRKSGGSRAKVGRKLGGGSDLVFVLHRSLRGRTPLRCKGPPGPFSRLRRGPRWLRHPCPVLRAPLRLRHPHPVLRAPLRLRVLFCGLLCDSGIRTLSCGPLCGGVCFPAGSSVAPASASCPAEVSAARTADLRSALRPVRATRCGCRLLRSLRPASASRFSHRRPGFPPRSCTPVSLQLRSRRTGPPGPDPPTARSGSAHRPCGAALRPPARHRGLAGPFPVRRPVRIVGNNP